MVKCLRQGGWRGGRRGQARRVGMVGRLLQGLDQVVSVLWIYGPEGTFAYALKETEEERGENERVVTGNVTRSLKAHRKNTAPKLPNTKLKVQTRPVHTGPCSAGR